MIVKLLKPLSFVPALLLMYMIYSFSAQDATTSSALSYQVSYTVVETGNVVLDAGLQPSEISSLATRFNGVVRKLAHVTEYFALAVAVAFPLYVYGLHGLPLMFVAGLFCVAFACTDEYHQSFVSGRGSTVRDVLIDSFGIFWGIILVRIVGWTSRKTIFRPFGKKKKKAGKETASTDEYFTNQASDSVYPPRYPNNPAYQRQQGQAHQGAQTYQNGQNWAYPNGQSCQNPQAQTYHSSHPYQGNQNQTYRGGQTYQQTYSGAQPYPPYGYGENPNTKKKKRQNNSDRLSEDMSLKKLMRDLTGKNEENSQ